MTKRPTLPNQLFKILALFIVTLGILGTIFIAISFAREPYENDHSPQLLSSAASLEKVGEREYYGTSYKDGAECDENQMKHILEKLGVSSEVNEQYHKCHVFALENGKIYWLQPANFLQYLVLEKPENNFQLLIQETRTAYPGPADEFAVRADAKSIIFRYEGYNNPRKIFKLTVIK